MKLSVCINTYRRPDRLAALLEDLTRQSLNPSEVIVVDNDADGSARPVVEERRRLGAPYALQYDIQTERNIALTRNRTVALAGGDWMAFVDDDERAPRQWLQQLVDAARAYSADGVLGPVVPEVPAHAPAWIRRGRFYDFPRMPSGTPVPLNRMRFGNVLLRADLLRAEPGPFDPAYGLSTGEDADLLIRLVRKSARVVWSDEAIVTEPIEARRLSLRWLLQRSLSGGQEFARKSVTGAYGRMSALGRAGLLCRSLVQLAAASLLTCLSWPFGWHRAAYFLLKVWASIGKISVFWGWRYREYA
ncbi:MAG TPA: glycosyltransferase family 2 protein [Steroidobacteraceae bacterium]|nr:glycosyltransferase family 2 protein [Steroidobacteraceae bacterium]